MAQQPGQNSPSSQLEQSHGVGSLSNLKPSDKLGLSTRRTPPSVPVASGQQLPKCIKVGVDENGAPAYYVRKQPGIAIVKELHRRGWITRTTRQLKRLNGPPGQAPPQQLVRRGLVPVSAPGAVTKILEVNRRLDAEIEAARQYVKGNGLGTTRLHMPPGTVVVDNLSCDCLSDDASKQQFRLRVFMDRKVYQRLATAGTIQESKQSGHSSSKSLYCKRIFSYTATNRDAVKARVDKLHEEIHAAKDKYEAEKKASKRHRKFAQARAQSKRAKTTGTIEEEE